MQGFPFDMFVSQTAQNPEEASKLTFPTGRTQKCFKRKSQNSSGTGEGNAKLEKK
jgi:hypothetical protein